MNAPLAIVYPIVHMLLCTALSSLTTHDPIIWINQVDTIHKAYNRLSNYLFRKNEKIMFHTNLVNLGK